MKVFQRTSMFLVCSGVLSVLVFGHVVSVADAICGSAQPIECSSYAKPRLIRSGTTLAERTAPQTTGKKPSTVEKRTPADEHYEKGRVLYKQGRYHEALKEFDRVIAIDAQYETAHSLRGATLLAIGKPEAAVRAIDKAITLATNKKMPEPWFTWPRLYKGYALIRLERFDGAINEFTLAIRSDHKNAITHAMRGEAYLSRLALDQEEMEDNAELAIKDLDRAIELNPKESRYWVNKAKAHFILNDTQRACEAVMRACDHGDCRLVQEFTECR